MDVAEKFKVSIKVPPVAFTLFVSLIFSLFCLTILLCLCPLLQEATAKTSNSMFPTTAQGNISTGNFFTYEDLSDRFTIHYPTGWEKIDYPRNTIAELVSHCCLFYFSASGQYTKLQGISSSRDSYKRYSVI